MKAQSLKSFCKSNGITLMKRIWKKCHKSDRLYITLLHKEDDENPIFAMTSASL